MMKKLKWPCVIICFILFILILINLNNNFILKLDNLVYQSIAKYHNPTLTNIMKFITNFGDTIIIFIVLIILIILLKNKKDKIILCLNVLNITLISQVIKIIIQRPRPSIKPLVIANGFSFPSGHSMVSIGFYGFIIYLIYQYIKNKKIKWLLMTLSGILILLIGISRIYLGVHYFTDVCSGFILGLALLIILITIHKRWEYYEK